MLLNGYGYCGINIQWFLTIVSFTNLNTTANLLPIYSDMLTHFAKLYTSYIFNDQSFPKTKYNVSFFINVNTNEIDEFQNLFAKYSRPAHIIQ